MFGRRDPRRFPIESWSVHASAPRRLEPRRSCSVLLLRTGPPLPSPLLEDGCRWSLKESYRTFPGGAECLLYDLPQEQLPGPLTAGLGRSEGFVARIMGRARALYGCLQDQTYVDTAFGGTPPATVTNGAGLPGGQQPWSFGTLHASTFTESWVLSSLRGLRKRGQWRGSLQLFLSGLSRLGAANINKHDTHALEGSDGVGRWRRHVAGG